MPPHRRPRRPMPVLRPRPVRRWPHPSGPTRYDAGTDGGKGKVQGQEGRGGSSSSGISYAEKTPKKTVTSSKDAGK